MPIKIFYDKIAHSRIVEHVQKMMFSLQRIDALEAEDCAPTFAELVVAADEIDDIMKMHWMHIARGKTSSKDFNAKTFNELLI